MSFFIFRHFKWRTNKNFKQQAKCNESLISGFIAKKTDYLYSVYPHNDGYEQHKVLNKVVDHFMVVQSPENGEDLLFLVAEGQILVYKCHGTVEEQGSQLYSSFYPSWNIRLVSQYMYSTVIRLEQQKPASKLELDCKQRIYKDLIHLVPIKICSDIEHEVIINGFIVPVKSEPFDISEYTGNTIFIESRILGSSFSVPAYSILIGDKVVLDVDPTGTVTL